MLVGGESIMTERWACHYAESPFSVQSRVGVCPEWRGLRGSGLVIMLRASSGRKKSLLGDSLDWMWTLQEKIVLLFYLSTVHSFFFFCLEKQMIDLRKFSWTIPAINFFCKNQFARKIKYFLFLEHSSMGIDWQRSSPCMCECVWWWWGGGTQHQEDWVGQITNSTTLVIWGLCHNFRDAIPKHMSLMFTRTIPLQ